jgi:hypothetical protein
MGKVFIITLRSEWMRLKAQESLEGGVEGNPGRLIVDVIVRMRFLEALQF